MNHGTRYGYDRHGCRCALCRAANTLHVAKVRAARLARLRASPEPESDPGHGTVGGYDAGCRCEACSLTRQSRYWNSAEYRERSGRHLWRDFVTSVYRDARDAWEALSESATFVPAAFSSGGAVSAYQLEPEDFRRCYPPPTLRETLIGLRDSRKFLVSLDT